MANDIDKEVLEELENLKRKASRALAITLALFAFCMVFGLMLGSRNSIIIPILFVVMIIAAVNAAKQNKAYNAYYKENVVLHMTLEGCDFLDNIHFDPASGIAKSEITDLGVLDSEIFSSNDLITAEYKGVAFRQSDVYMADRHTDSDGHTTESTVFRGRWLVFDFNKNFEWNLELISKGFATARRIGGIFSFGRNKTEKIVFENAAFNKMFKVYAENQEEAFYIITPHIMEALMRLKQSLDAPLLLMFSEGRLHIAVFNGEDAFEGKIFGKLDINEEQSRLFNDLKLITDFVDELALERNIFKA